MRLIALLFAPFTAFIAQPWLALVPAALFAILHRAARRPVVAAAAFAWPAYAIYEYSMRRRWLCSGECNIRIDLLLLYPALLLVSLAALMAGIGTIRRRGSEE
jgi:hypothetical protein